MFVIINLNYFFDLIFFFFEFVVILSVNIVVVIVSFVFFGSIIFFCVWCYKCWKGLEDEKDGSGESDYDFLLDF